MKIKYRLLSSLLAFVLVAGNCSQIVAYADDNTVSMRTAANAPQKNESVKELTDLEITDLEEPGEGKPLDTKATVRSAEGVTWEIPVVWIGEDGKAATVAEPGKKYVPNFAFYIPKGYGVRGSSAFGRLSIRLPQFLQKYGLYKLIYAFDPVSGITYISWDMTNIFEPAYQISVYEPKESDSDSSDGGDEDDEDDADNEDKDPYWEVKVHCTRNLIANIGYESLAGFVDLIKNEIEPRAIAALMEGFPAFAEAADRKEIGSSIGLYIYDARFDSIDEDPRNYGDGVDASVSAGSVEDDFYYVLNVNSEHILTRNESGEYILDDAGLTETKNIIIHELMHAVMDDYTRTGMNSKDDAYFNQHSNVPRQEPQEWNAFPKWFFEGAASTVHHVYRYQNVSFYCMSEQFYQADPQEELYTERSVLRAFQDNNPRTSANIRMYRSDYDNDIGGAYAGGYLALVYLSTIIATESNSPEIPHDSDTVRRGLNSILEMLHNGLSLNQIIIDHTAYSSLIDFENCFANESDYSLTFTVQYLNFLDQKSTEENRANGSILLPFDTQMGDPLEGRTETSNGQSVLKVADTSDYVKSTADKVKAESSAGSYHEWQDPVDGQAAMIAAAAVTSVQPEEEPAAEETPVETPASEGPAADVPAVEASAAEAPSEEPVAEEPAGEDSGEEESASEESEQDDTSEE